MVTTGDGLKTMGTVLIVFLIVFFVPNDKTMGAVLIVLLVPNDTAGGRPSQAALRAIFELFDDKNNLA